MQIVKDQNNVVLFAGDSYTLTETGLQGPGFVAPNVKVPTHALEAVDSVPGGWAGGDYAYDGEWVLTARGVAKRTAEFQSAKTQKSAELTAYVKQYLSIAMQDYSEWEAILWPILIQEAEQFAADGTVGEYMAAEIGVKYPTAADLATIVFQRKEAMKQLRAGVVLTRQRKEAQIEAAETVEDLNKITIQEGWPE